MLKKRVSLVLVLALFFSLVPIGYGFSQEKMLEPLTPAPIYGTADMTDETPQLWFVELSGNPIAEGGRANSLAKERNDFRADAKKAKLQFEERFSFDNLWNGLSVRVAPGQLSKLARIPGVKALYPVAVVSIPETQQVAPELFTALSMTGADKVQSELGFTGQGIKVAVMDTGIDYSHPDLGGGYGPGYRVVTGWDFVGDDYNADPSHPGYNPIPSPKADPMDLRGHGTHVAGIIGANGATKGVAPDVLFGAYKVFGTEGSTTADIMMMAMERALADGMHVLNMSIGSAFQWPQYPTAKAADRLVNKGMVVVASIGNSGADGIYSAGAPGVGEKVIGVASFDNSDSTAPYFTVNDTPVGYIPMSFSVVIPVSGTLPMARTGAPGTRAGRAADPLPEGSLTGKAALIERGEVAFSVKAQHAYDAGAIAVVIYNSTPGMFSGTLGAPGIPIPVVGISREQGLWLNSLIVAAETALVEMTWTDQIGPFPSPTGGLISGFSSYGLAPDLSLKPDIGAPGGNIYAPYPLAKGGYASLSGTSMSSPHVAGAVALLLEAQPRLRAHQVRSVLQNTAVPKPWWGNPGLGFLDNVHRQGAGMLNIEKAILATTRINPGKLSLGESEHGPSVQSLTIENRGNEAVTYTLSHVPALSSGPNTFPVGATTGFATVGFDLPTITVPAGGRATVVATITANPALPEGSLYGGYLVFDGDNGETLRVPYAGYKGDYQARTAMWIAGLVEIIDSDLYLLPEGASYSLVGEDMPLFAVGLHHQVQILRAEIHDAHDGRYWHRAFDYQYYGRNRTIDEVFVFEWDGVVMRGNNLVEVPNGDYVVKLSVLKALGDANNPDHWETWTSPVITIEREIPDTPTKPGKK
jgi:subtilisin family serine protease